MNILTEVVQIQYEISMAIGTSLNLNEMLRTAFSVILRKLNCSGGLLLSQYSEGRKYIFKTIYSVPKQQSSGSQSAEMILQKIPEMMDTNELSDFFQKMPIEGQLSDNSFYYIMELPDFGIIIIFRRNKTLPYEMIQSLLPLNKKLANACKACVSQDKLTESKEKYRHLSIRNSKLVEEKEKYAQQLKAAKEEAEKAHNIKSMLLSNMSHELRTPLNSIYGLSHFLSNTPLSMEQKDYVRRIVRSSESMKQLVDDLLDIQKLEAGNILLQDKEINVRMLIEYITTILQPYVEQKGIAFEVDIDDTVPEIIIGDPLRLEQILMNLLSNAIKYTEQGFVALKITTGDCESNQNMQMKFTVIDTGIGIPSDKLEKIFNRFEQGDMSYRKKYQGAGLGLAIVKQLTDLMDCKITVSSEPGNGTTFHFTGVFKIKTEEKDVKEENNQEKQVAVNKDISLNLLIVEDNQDNLFLLKTVVKGYFPNIRIYVAENGLMAIETYKTAEIDFILMDVQLPVMDGVEATQHIREYEKETGTHVPIIGITAYTLEEEKTQFEESGMDMCMTKPIKKEDLDTILCTYVHN